MSKHENNCTCFECVNETEEQVRLLDLIETDIKRSEEIYE
jgi:hypothetical protein